MDDGDNALERADSSVANRDEAIPVFRIPSRADLLEPSSSSDVEQKARKRDKLKGGMDKIKDTIETQYVGPVRQGLGDRMFANMLSYVVPSDALGDDDDDEDEVAGSKRKDRRSRKYVDRPNFSLPMMTTNFRRFNARIGIVFVLENRIIHLFTWKQPSATLSFLAVWSLLSLSPHLLPIIPLIGLLFFIMIPSFVARHPISKNDPRLEPTYTGPAVAPASRVKPAPDLSKDFMHNMRDLQNSMEDFSRMHDAANEYVTPYTNFSDEKTSSTVFLILFIVSCTAFISQFIPWRFIALAAGWGATLMGHPSIRPILLSSRNLSQVRTTLDDLSVMLKTWIDADIVLDEPPERRQVEIFELQKHHVYSDTWESWLFSPTPYDPLSPLRIAGARAKGTQFFEDVQPPSGWGWKDKKWMLDLASREWVEQRMVTGVEIETEGERWVYDLPEDVVDSLATTPTKSKKSKDKFVPKSGWEEGNGLGERGKWRRRRWVRVVERNIAERASAKPS
ncbi:Peroxisome size and maintenance regulator [Extremus antarcticus]|uniref:Peroxisome size and maintenance regulator n=1 Tax=Extremus antarcticus TaxID=702011 RepID=A0AAJ0GIZ0_9PEZI|nr:Peroxisome size and maintenance regulator [Extremus antarcticus]